MIHRSMHGFAFAVVLSAMLASASHTDAQNPSKVGDEVAAGSVDRPTQRWIPLPDNDATGLSAQAQLLQELQELLSGNEPPPKLSEKQLKQMEETFKQLRDELGEDMLPKLEDIPKEWINEALSDPLVRQQARSCSSSMRAIAKCPLGKRVHPRHSEFPFHAAVLTIHRQNRTATTISKTIGAIRKSLQTPSRAHSSLAPESRPRHVRRIKSG